MTVTRTVAAAILATGMSLGLAGAATAQAPAQPPAAQAPAEAQFTEDQIASFAVAVLGINDVSNRYLPQLETAETPEAQEQIRLEAEQEMMTTVDDAGLTVDEYNAVAMAAQSDPTVAQQVLDQLEEIAPQ